MKIKEYVRLGIVSMLSFYYVSTLWDFFFDKMKSSMLSYVVSSFGSAVIFVLLILFFRKNDKKD
jgi:phosphoglycerol transferase MdoB-like AlkP superfamily enzyme